MSFLFLNRADVDALCPWRSASRWSRRPCAHWPGATPSSLCVPPDWMPDRHGLLVVMPGMLGRRDGGVAGAKVLTRDAGELPARRGVASGARPPLRARAGAAARAAGRRRGDGHPHGRGERGGHPGAGAGGRGGPGDPRLGRPGAEPSRRHEGRADPAPRPGLEPQPRQRPALRRGGGPAARPGGRGRWPRRARPSRGRT